jgi:glycosyltransferase involved in cell wall biosynthesis
MKALGVVMVYNEADIVGLAVSSLVDAGHEVHVFNHGSNDGSGDVALAAGAHQIHPIPRTTPLFKIWSIISQWIKDTQERKFDWITWQAADEVLRPPADTPMRNEDLDVAAAKGIDVIEPRIKLYWPTVADDMDEPDVVERLQHYRWIKSPIRPNNYVPRSWRSGLTGKMPPGLHRYPARWGGKAKVLVDRNHWILEHRPIRSVEQARRKVMKERRPSRSHPQVQYAGLRKHRCNNVIRPVGSFKCLKSS